jgi:1-aminocyclopropane-1-carboxylate deaminase/D-cysteine desulfhydrase-like pyridoxal-dependent ACC family enzyme
MKKGVNPVELDSSQGIIDYLKIFREIVQQEIAKAKFSKHVLGVVSSTPAAGLCNIKINNEGAEVIDVKIRDGLTLVVGNEVYVEMINNSSSNFFIDIKK